MMTHNDTDTVKFPNVSMRPLQWVSGSGAGGDLSQAEGYKAIVDLNTGKVFTIVTDEYRLIRHEEAIERIETALAYFPEFGKFEVQDAFYNDKGRMRRTYRFTGIPIEIKPGDLVHPELQLYNSYDKTWPFTVTLGALRVICTNGLVVGEEYMRFQKRHIPSLERIDLREEVFTALGRLGDQAEVWRAWSGSRLSETAYGRVMETMQFGERAEEGIGNRIAQEADGVSDEGFPILTMWAFYNILTWYITHMAVSLNHRVTLEERLRKAIIYIGSA